MRHIMLLIILAAIFGPLSRCLASPPAVAKPRPNVLFIVSDDLNNLLGCYGDRLAKTPNIDVLAGRGARFDRAYCTFPLCGPSRNSFLTGLYPNATGILRNSQIFRQAIPQQVSMPQAFRRAGYFVARIGKLFHYDVPWSVGTNGHDDPASWELELNPAGVDRLEEQPDIFTIDPPHFGGTLSWYASPRPDEQHTDGMMAADATWVLERCAKDRSRPFFLGLGFFRPHTPYVAPRDPYFGWHPPEKMPAMRAAAHDRADVPEAAFASSDAAEKALSDDLRRQCRQAYNASISFMDAQVGRVIDALDRLSLADDTIIVFTSDHGYHMGEHGLWQKQSLFEESARVPLLIVAPGTSRPGVVVPAPVSQIDLFPTLAGLCGVPTPSNLQGQSLVPMLSNPAHSGRGWALTQVSRSSGKDSPIFFGYSLRTPRWRYTEWDEGRAGRELYDHDADPGELVNLAASAVHAADVAELSKLLREAVAATLPADGVTPKVRPGGWGISLRD